MSKFLPARLRPMLGQDLDSLAEVHLQNLIGIGEDEDLDFKQTLYPDTENGKRDLAGDIAALANAKGGLLVLGVAENAQGEAAALTPFTLPQHEEPLRVRQVLASRVFPTPDIGAKVVESSQQGSGYLIVSVPASPTAPHAVREGDRLRYLKRTGTGNRVLAESEVADMYRNRFLEARTQIDLLGRVHNDGIARIAKERAWLAMSLVPSSRGGMELLAGTPERLATWARDVDGLCPNPPLAVHQRTLRFSTRISRIVLTDAQTPSGEPYSFYAELHTVGAGCAAGMVGWKRESERFNTLGMEDPPAEFVLIPDERLGLLTAELLFMLAAHAVGNAGCVGDAVVRATLHTITEGASDVPMCLYQARTTFPGPLGHRYLTTAAASEHTVDLSESSTPGSGLLATVRLIATDLCAEFGHPELAQFTTGGSIRRRCFSNPDQERMAAWAQTHGVPVSDETVGV